MTLRFVSSRPFYRWHANSFRGIIRGIIACPRFNRGWSRCFRLTYIVVGRESGGSGALEMSLAFCVTTLEQVGDL